MADQLEQIRNSLGQYILAMNRGYAYVPFHQERLVPALEAVEKGKIRRLMVNLPPRHAKTEICTISFLPWWIGRHPRGNALVASYSYELAKTFGAKLKQRMEDPLYIKLFPKAQLSKAVRARNYAATVNGGNWYAVGFDGAMSGKGSSLVILDDAIKNHEEAESVSRQDFLMDIYESTIKARLEPTPDGFMPAIVIAMTRWAIRDFCGRVLEKEGRIEEGGQWTVLTLEAQAADGKFLWPERFAKDHYIKAKESSEDTWAALYQQNPGLSTSFWFRKEWLNFYPIAIPPNRYNTYLIIDPAGKPSKKSDFTSMHVWAAGQEGKLFLVDWIFDKLDPGVRVQLIMQLVRRWRPRMVIYEEYGLVSDTYYITEKMKAAGMDERFYPIPVGRKGPRHNLSKNERIKGIIPFFREGKIHLPKKFEYKQDYNGKTIDLVDRFVKEEFMLFKGEGSIPHEDDLDAMSRLLEPELSIQYHRPPDDEDDDDYRATQGSWESRY